MAGRYEQLELKDVDEVDNELSTATRSSTAGAWLFSATRNVHPAHMWHRLKQVLLLWTLVSLLLYSWLVFFSERVSTSYVSPRLLGATNILWLTAHPDDESMFFAPSIFNLLSRHTAPNGTSLTSTGHILSLSSGNNDGLGAQRTIEMRAACLGLGITTENCIVLDVNTLPDDPNVWWPEDVIEYWTRAYIDKWSIDTIVTFDEDGISGHANHRAINAALVKASNFDLEFPPVFTLRTTRSVLAKYSSMLLYPYVRISHRWRVNHPLPAIQWDPDVFPIAKQRHEFLHKPPRFQQKEFRSGYSHPFSQHATLLVNSPWQYLKSRTAFKQHKSQVLWFRRLYMFASRYMWFNELLGVDRIHERVVDLGKVREAARKDSL